MQTVKTRSKICVHKMLKLQLKKKGTLHFSQTTRKCIHFFNNCVSERRFEAIFFTLKNHKYLINNSEIALLWIINFFYLLSFTIQTSILFKFYERKLKTVLKFSCCCIKNLIYTTYPKGWRLTWRACGRPVVVVELFSLCERYILA